MTNSFLSASASSSLIRSLVMRQLLESKDLASVCLELLWSAVEQLRAAPRISSNASDADMWVSKKKKKKIFSNDSHFNTFQILLKFSAVKGPKSGADFAVPKYLFDTLLTFLSLDRSNEKVCHNNNVNPISALLPLSCVLCCSATAYGEFVDSLTRRIVSRRGSRTCEVLLARPRGGAALRVHREAACCARLLQYSANSKGDESIRHRFCVSPLLTLSFFLFRSGCCRSFECDSARSCVLFERVRFDFRVDRVASFGTRSKDPIIATTTR